ncbi:MAG: histidine phosphatase family protein [Dehalococcoidia bacterium]
MLLSLVRHAAPVVRLEQPSLHWHLSAEGRVAVDTLAEQPFWSDVAIIYSSPEPKALATAQGIAARHELRIGVVHDLREVEDRAWVERGYEELARRYLAGEDVRWEQRDAVLHRVRSAIDDIIARHEGADVALVSHGLAPTVYLAERLALDAQVAFELWSRLRMPDVGVLDTETNELVREFGGGHGQAPVQQ